MKAGPVARADRPARAFTLLEVMIAVAIFFMAVFAILGMVAQNLKIARGLRLGQVELGTAAAQIALTNKLDEGTVSGDFGENYPGASWSADIWLYSTGGLYQADITIQWPQNGLVREEKSSIWLFRPQSVPRGAGFRQ